MATAAQGSQTPEIASSSVLAYTLAVQHGSPNDAFLGDVGDNTPVSETHVLARVLSFTPSQARTVTRVYEINNAVAGRAVELIPGGISDDNVSISRVEGYQQTILEALDPRGHRFIDDKGNETPNAAFPKRGGMDNLTFQKKPFHLLRYVIFPQKMLGGQGGSFKNETEINTRLDIYCHCFVESISKTIDVSGGGGGLVQSEATIQVTKRRSRFLQVGDSRKLMSSMVEAADVSKFGQPMEGTSHPDYNVETNQYNSGPLETNG